LNSSQRCSCVPFPATCCSPENPRDFPTSPNPSKFAALLPIRFFASVERNQFSKVHYLPNFWKSCFLFDSISSANNCTKTQRSKLPSTFCLRKTSSWLTSCGGFLNFLDEHGGLVWHRVRSQFSQRRTSMQEHFYHVESLRQQTTRSFSINR
jgi:hypothetical protein